MNSTEVLRLSNGNFLSFENFFETSFPAGTTENFQTVTLHDSSGARIGEPLRLRVGELSPARDGRDRKARREALGHDQDVGRRLGVVLRGEHAPRPAKARLDFVENELGAVADAAHELPALAPGAPGVRPAEGLVGQVRQPRPDADEAVAWVVGPWVRWLVGWLVC